MFTRARPTHLGVSARLGATTILLLLLSAGAALANGGSTWPSSYGPGTANYQANAVGPTSPGLAWLSTTEDVDGWGVDGRNAGTAGNLGDLVLSSNGDLLATASRTVVEDGEEVREGALIALDGETGELRWAAIGIDDACKPAVATEGHIWALQELTEDTRLEGDNPDALRALVALDPEDGEILPGLRYTGDEVPLRPASLPCGDYGLQLASDGAVLVRDNSGFDPTVRAVEPDGTERWVEVFPRACRLESWVQVASADAPNSDRVYLAVAAGDDCPYQGRSVIGLDLATGEAVAELQVPGLGFGRRSAQAVLPDGDLIITTQGPSGNDAAHLLRLRDDGGLTIVWQIDIDPSESASSPACADRICDRILMLAASPAHLVVHAGSSNVASIDPADGSVRWIARTPQGGGLSPTGPVVLDQDGNAFVGRATGLGGTNVSVLSLDGTEIGTFEAVAGVTTPRALGPLTEDGTLFGRDSAGTWFALTDDPDPIGACINVAVPDAGFTDVSPGSVHAPNIDCIVFYELAQGITATTYGPSRSVTRQQMATFIARLVDASDRPLPAAGPRFGDVSGVHEDNINRLAAAGIVQGTSPTTFNPEAPVRRDQMASFLVRAFEYIVEREVEAGPTPFQDIEGNTHEANIEKVAELGFTTGLTPTRYDPFASVRRDQMASFLARALETLVADEGRIDARS